MVHFRHPLNFGHARIIDHCYREFDSIDAHDEALVKNWNDRVDRHDTVYHLGDFALCSKKRGMEILSSLRGNIVLIRGNHDKKIKGDYARMFGSVHDYLEIKPDGQKICLMHFPIESWNMAHYGSWHLHGHCHNNLQSGDRKRLDVGVDAWGYCPVSLEQISETMAARGFEQVDHHGKRPTWNLINLLKKWTRRTLTRTWR